MKKGNYCPLIKKDCIEHKCAWYGQIRGVNPNTGQEVDEFQCVINLVPMLLIENTHKQTQTSAAIESFRNESIKQNSFNTQALSHTLTQAALMGAITKSDIKVLPDHPFLPEQ